MKNFSYLTFLIWELTYPSWPRLLYFRRFSFSTRLSNKHNYEVTAAIMLCRATVVQSFSTFWTNIESAAIREHAGGGADGDGDENAPKPTTVSTLHLFNCRLILACALI